MALNDKNFRSRFQKLAGLGNGKKSAKKSGTLLSENKVSQLLSDGFSYRDIAIMEQQNTTLQNKGNFLDPQGFVNPDIFPNQPAPILAPGTNIPVNIPQDGTGNQNVTPPANVTPTGPPPNVTPEGGWPNDITAMNLDLPVNMSDDYMNTLAPNTETPTANDPSGAAPNTTDATTNVQQITIDLLKQQFPNAPEEYLDLLMRQKYHNGDTTEMENWLTNNETVNNPGLEAYDQDAYDNDPVNQQGDFVTADGQDFEINLDSSGDQVKQFRTWFNGLDKDDPTRQKIVQAWKDDSTIGSSSATANAIENGLKVNNGHNKWIEVAVEAAGDDYINTVVTSNNLTDNREVKKQNLNKLNTYNAASNDELWNPFEDPELDLPPVPEGETVTFDNTEGGENETPVDGTETPVDGTETPVDGTTTPVDTDDSTDTSGGKLVNPDDGKPDEYKPNVPNYDSEKRHKSYQIHVDASGNVVAPGTEGSSTLDADSWDKQIRNTQDESGRKGYSQYTDWGAKYIEANYDTNSIKPGSKEYDKLMKHYNKNMAKNYKNAQKDYYKSDYKGKGEMDYSDYQYQSKKDKNQKKNQKKNNKKNNKKNDPGNIKLKDLLRTQVSDTNAYIDSQGNMLPANLRGR